VNLLLDTHAVLWFADDSPQMPEPLKALIEQDDCLKYVSIASVWEIAIKVSTGKLTLSAPIEEFIPALFRRNGFLLLPVRVEHALRIASLPFHHKDPFDRLLIAQSLVEKMPIASIEAIFDLYGVERRW
jgi:PIN domain nuclease of toxin-antitoxin system